MGIGTIYSKEYLIVLILDFVKIIDFNETSGSDNADENAPLTYRWSIGYDL